ncbi:TIR domain-containing protein [Rhizobium sp. BK418]|uniref:TIR domain-containing protein n=1 Tax=Rhizobium sp. BK418 TaxID=2512120 RepID=UPI00104BEF3D|nr:TIR domain-containing protein [Rhizobium sp. BK418]TCR95968.1 putative nucleotide-binding protein with TIR-like domain [Rhizobium sp. BK418]
MENIEELHSLSEKFEAVTTFPNSEIELRKLDALIKAAEDIGVSFSGSWLGYHSNIYYAGFKEPRPGDHFSQEWGFKSPFGSRRSDSWQEYSPKVVSDAVREKAGSPDLTKLQDAERDAARGFDELSATLISILHQERDNDPSDKFIAKLLEDAERLHLFSPAQVANKWAPKGQIMTRDTTAIGQGTIAPPHMLVRAEAVSIEHTFDTCKAAAAIAKKAASHIERRERRSRRESRVGTDVFIGHGRSLLWRELKDFVSDRLRLPWNEFNRIPVAGMTNIGRLSEMLESAAIALIIMTAEDELADGEVQARMNVIHEVGLFQGRLGFSKAIVLVEDGCKMFSNIDGLGQIRFPKGNIKAAFEEVRAVMEREGLVD